jgi:hypothetical protein
MSMEVTPSPLALRRKGRNTFRPATANIAIPSDGLGKQADGSYLIALDWDNDEAALVAMERFPSTALKEGARGVTMLYRSPVPIASRNFMVNGIPVMQVLADGR